MYKHLMMFGVNYIAKKYETIDRDNLDYYQFHTPIKELQIHYRPRRLTVQVLVRDSTLNDAVNHTLDPI